MAKQHEYAFDCKLWAVVRVKATSEKKAREAAMQVIDAVDVTPAFIGGFNEEAQQRGVRLTEVSIAEENEGGLDLIEIDGEAPEED